ncbi:TetR/AcrR family transcriptional regulator [Actinomadura rugatobispora]|uniref:TetR/AcrR family transcriptional regulator n=1 Tax=Actinomadura rugatobispora TaxID=1994 RepID=A0ABW1A0F6_9ACTN|nr:TetR/AcrR family transcriptional regulator [Actinomadura rugatobispora]
MVDDVKADLRAARVADTEEKILSAATRLFLEHGYAGTTLTAVAAQARVGVRTVYVRFGTKAALLKRVADVAMVGDTAPVAVSGRPWFVLSGSAPTLDERITAMASGGREMMVRASGLLAVALEAAPTEPVLAEAAQAAREATRDNLRHFWTRAAGDGLLPADRDIAWLTETSAILVHVETYLLGTRMHGWSPEQYERWLITGLTRLAAG